MTEIKQQLFDAFSHDHAVFGKGLFELRTLLAAHNLEGARSVAESLDKEVGAHIAFEEEEFYPALKPFLSGAEIESMYQQHSNGITLLTDILDTDPSPESCADLCGSYLTKLDDLERHVSDCGDLFGAMGALTPDKQAILLERLQFWRAHSPSWREYEASKQPAKV